MQNNNACSGDGHMSCAKHFNDTHCVSRRMHAPDRGRATIYYNNSLLRLDNIDALTGRNYTCYTKPNKAHNLQPAIRSDYRRLQSPYLTRQHVPNEWFDAYNVTLVNHKQGC